MKSVIQVPGYATLQIANSATLLATYCTCRNTCNMLSKRRTEASCLLDRHLTTISTYIQNHRDLDLDAIAVVDSIMGSIAVASVIIVVTFLDSPFVKQSCVARIELTMVSERDDAALEVSPGTAST